MLNRMSSSAKKHESINITTPQTAGETFTFSPSPGNIDPYTHSDQPPSFDLRKCPSMTSVIALRHYLSLSHDLPNEIIDIILDLAEYWPHTSSILDMTTRVYSGHMCYGSYPARPRQKLGRLLSSPESRREWKEDGFLIRTPPLGWRCVSGADVSQRTSQPPGTTRPRAKSKPLIPAPRPPTWLPPRGLHPARRVVFEILSREERLGNTHRQGSTFYYANSKTSFDASIDRISFPKTTKKSINRSIDPLLWTTEAATKDCRNQQPSDVCYTIRSTKPAKSSSSKSSDHENSSSGVTKNYTAHNRKVVRTWRYDGAERCFLPTTDRDFGSENATEFVKGLKEGDCVSLWARARKSEEHGRRRPGEQGRAWCNVVDRVAIHVFWAV